jgi:hypothetical protein
MYRYITLISLYNQITMSEITMLNPEPTTATFIEVVHGY